MSDAYGEIIRIAAILARRKVVPDLSEHQWQASTGPRERRRILRLLRDADDRCGALAQNLADAAKAMRANNERLRGLLLKAICTCGSGSPDPMTHDAIACPYRAALAGPADQPAAARVPPNAPTLDEIRARCAENVTEMCTGAAEYYRMQTIIRDRAALLAYYDRDVKLAPTTPQPNAAQCAECKGTTYLYNGATRVDCDVCEGTGTVPPTHQPPVTLSEFVRSPPEVREAIGEEPVHRGFAAQEAAHQPADAREICEDCHRGPTEISRYGHGEDCTAAPTSPEQPA